MKLPFKCIYFAWVILHCSCSNAGNSKDSWNLLGGSYWKHGEMIVYDGYWLEVYKDTINNSHVILLVQKGKTKFITDSLKIGTLPDSILFDYGTVQFNEQQDPRLVALYKVGDSLNHYNIFKAWRANIQTGKFEPVPTEGIKVVTQ